MLVLYKIYKEIIIYLLKWLLLVGSVGIFVVECVLILQVADYKKALKLFGKDEGLEEQLAEYKEMISSKKTIR